jgi:pentatricopeptide repeat domain-containing protein 1
LIEESKRSGDWKRAVAAANDVLVNGNLTESIATGVIRAFGESGDLGRAISVLGVMKSKNIKPNEHHYGALMQCCKRTNQWSMALEIFQMMKKQNVSRNTFVYNILLSALAKSSQASYILETLQEMKKDQVDMDIVSYSTAIFAFSKCNRPQESLRLWNELLVSDTLKPNTILVNNVLYACKSARMWSKVIEVFEMSQRIGIEADPLSNCIIASGELYDFESAVLYFNMSDNLSGSRVKRDTGIYNALILACERTRRSVDARYFIKQMISEGIEPDVKTFSSAISACGKAGDALGSLELVQEMKKIGAQHSISLFYYMILTTKY